MIHKILNKTTQEHCVYVLFVFFIVLSVFTFQDYGISWDEPCQQDFGELASEKIFHQEDNPEYDDVKKNYGVSFEVILVQTQKMLEISESASIYKFRHFFTHILFLLASLIFYFILKNTSVKK